MIVEIYQDEHGNEPFIQWLASIRDSRTCARIDNRLERVRKGNFGDHQSLGGGLFTSFTNAFGLWFELRLHFGAGYRIYYGRLGEEVVVLLGGGSKRGQARDIQRAHQCWKDYQRSKEDETHNEKIQKI
jgi:putative addiction module killer protein